MILKLIGVESDVLEYATIYIRIRSFEMPAVFLVFAFQAIRRATGDTLTPVIINSIAIAINIVLTAVLILGFNMGITGAAIATLVGQLVMIPIVLYFLINAKTVLKLNLKLNILIFLLLRK